MNNADVITDEIAILKNFVKVNGSFSRYKDYVGFSTHNIQPKELLVISDKKTKHSKLYVSLLIWVDLTTVRVMSPLVGTSGDTIEIMDLLIRTSTESGTPEVRIPRKSDCTKMRRVRITWEEVKLKKVYAHFGKYPWTFSKKK